MNTEPQFIELVFSVSAEYADALQGFLMMNATVEGIEEMPNGEMRYSIPIPEWNDELQSSIDGFIATLPKNAAALFGAAPIEVRNWNAEWEASIEPVRVTNDLVVSPSWKEADAAVMGTTHIILIDPKMSFGTGHHETTRLCLRAMESINCEGLSVLDIGTGSGILAIYALMRGAVSAVGIDTDEWAVENVTENSMLNHIDTDKFNVCRGTLETVAGPGELFDLIFANIHRNVLVEIAGDVASHAKLGAALILSGILTFDADEVAAAYEKAGFQLRSKLSESEWVALVMERT